ncbi:class I SAM-dependent methyltransferase [Coleofasciculus sp. FACHB-1120]|uniref:class I SAM-dependent methyltransferase n=1 Tax=Coleofasciculus sp. FACHB-1120 TaxID=2692783 RepID=UPI001688BED5|nr:class I SAM-dependent methyltransferase [Coleofasciculus sp. FACHB-1120]MBD2744191.1 class I SAM-dependent methyltransferase [Coleofasciculus sp. FACHB-1120]
MHESESLLSLIAQRIANSPNQRITFAQYMEWVLYEPDYGYYATNAVNIGPEGDFFTAPNLGADFGELLAEQFVQMWDILGRPGRFTLVEMGAGQGLLAADILLHLHQHHPAFFNALEYLIVEKAAGLISQQQQVLQKLAPIFAQTQGATPVRWCSLEEIPSASITGCFFSNELVDALPVHQFAIAQGKLREIYVTMPDGTHFEEVIGELSTPQLAEYFDLVGIKLPSAAYADGYRSEINLAAQSWLSTVADKLKRGYLLTIDYGYPAARYYNPQRSQGTLQCYYQHRHHNDPYVQIGQQDITAHVDFTALERWGDRCGLALVGFTKQALFLMALGLGDRIAALSNSDRPIIGTQIEQQSIMDVLRRRDALHQLIDPTGLGGFGVLVQCKGLREEERKLKLKGLTMP